jgi:hypothetical protein
LVAVAERVLADLHSGLNATTERQAAIADERASIALAAINGDQATHARLAKLRQTASTIHLEIEDVQAAMRSPSAE